jgi:uncharacterized protein YqeY
MSLEEQINQDMKAAMKAKDKAGLRGLRAIKSALLMANTDGSGEEVNEEKEIQILQKLVKQRKESLSIYEEQNREDLAEKELEEIETIKKYLPEPLSEAALKAKLREIIDNLGASSMKDMGAVMSNANQTLAGKADSSMMAKFVKDLLK